MLGEDEAYALLERHCAPLRRVFWPTKDFPRLYSWIDAAHYGVDLVVQAPSVGHMKGTEGLAVGARTRLALSVAQAVSCCRGLEPATNQAFWRRAALSLWSRRGIRRTDTDHMAFTNATFTHVAVEWTSSASHRVDDAFWVGFLHGTAATVAALAGVLNQLRPHWTAGAPPPPLRVSLSCCYAREPLRPEEKANTNASAVIADAEPVVSPRALRTILGAALTAPPSGTAWATEMHLGLVVTCRVGDDNPETLALLACALTAPPLPHLRLSLDRLAIQLASQYVTADTSDRQAFVTRLRALGAILSALLTGPHAAWPVDAFDVLGCSYSDYRLVGAALSAMAVAPWPTTMRLRCSTPLDASRPQEQLLRLAWLAFVLLRRSQQRQRASPPPPLSLVLLSKAVAVGDPERAYIQQLSKRGTPLRDVVGEALRRRLNGDDDAVARLRVVECLPLGLTVRLTPGTRLYVEPMRVAEASEAVALAPEKDTQVDWIAHVVTNNDDDEDEASGWVGVVYAGYGLLWISAACVTAWQRAEERAYYDDDNDVVMDENNETERAAGAAMCALVLNFDGMHGLPAAVASIAFRVASLLPLFACSVLTALTVNCAVLLRDDLALLLASFPSLQSLSLDRCVVESATPLIDAYTSPRCSHRPPTVLSLRGVHDLRLRHRLTDRLVTLRHYSASHAQRGDAAAWITPLVSALAVGVTRGLLHELYVDCAAMASPHEECAVVETLARAVVASSSVLRRLHVTTLATDACVSALAPLRGAVLADAPDLRRAALSVLRACGCAAPDIARIVLAMAQGAVVRTITWDSFRNS